MISNVWLDWIRDRAGWPPNAEELVRRAHDEEGRGVLTEELLGDKDGPGDEA